VQDKDVAEVTMKNPLFWNVTPYILVKVHEASEELK
jgi:hypothetical protein